MTLNSDTRFAVGNQVRLRSSPAEVRTLGFNEGDAASDRPQ